MRYKLKASTKDSYLWLTGWAAYSTLQVHGTVPERLLMSVGYLESHQVQLLEAAGIVVTEEEVEEPDA